MNDANSKAKDPICGMMVDQSTNIKTMRDGTIFYFCSDHCMQKFLSAPAGKTTPMA